jgi:hypothetical protein
MARTFAWTLQRRIGNKIKIDPETGCWHWQGSKMHNGYGQMGVGGRLYAAHRYIYEQTNNISVPKHLDLDHLCRNRGCVNPEHLEPVTRSENLKRGMKRGERQREKTHCPKGHPYDEANTYHHPSGKRCCRTCGREWQSALRIKAKESNNG